MVKVSIIVPAFNAEKSIERCIKSILGQTLDSIEVIIIDDGSKDKTGEICKKFMADSRIRYYKKDNGGPASARNAGLDVACGEYIGFVDADDEVKLDMYEKMYSTCIRNAADIGVCDIIRCFENGECKYYTDKRREGVYSKDQIATEIIPFCLGYRSDKGTIEGFDWSVLRHLFSRTFLRNNHIVFNESLRNSEDGLFVISSICRAGKIVYLKKGFYINHINFGSTSWKYYPEYWENRRELICRLRNEMIQYDENYNEECLSLQIVSSACASLNNVTFAFSHYSNWYCYKQIKTIMCDELVQKAIQKVNYREYNDYNSRLFRWISKKNVLLMYYYLKDVVGKSRWHHNVRKIIKRINRVIPFTEYKYI